MNTTENQSVVVLGMGNPLLCDDSIGLHVLQCARRELSGMEGVWFKENFSGGLDLLYDVMDFDQAIIVDCIQTGNMEAGTCREFPLSALKSLSHDRLVHAHGVGLLETMEIGERLGYRMPREVVILGIEGDDLSSFSTNPTPRVGQCVAAAIELIQKRLLSWLPEKTFAETI